MELIQLNLSKCTRCMMCITACPVQAIGTDHAQENILIRHNRCIGCGNCISVCRDEAISYYRSTEDVKKLLAGNNPVAAVVDPSIAAEFPDITDYRKFAGMIRQLGFMKVAETAFAIELLAARFAALVDNFRGKYYITSHCPPVVFYVQKYMPQQLENLVPFMPPMAVMAAVIRQAYGENYRVVAITPCIAHKTEAGQLQLPFMVDAAITFTELREMFTQSNITETRLEYSDFDPPHGRVGSLFPIDNGFVQIASLSEDIIGGKVMTTAGKERFLSALSEFEEHPEIFRRNLNIFYDKGCMMGPGMSNGGGYYQRYELVSAYADKRAGTIDKKAWQQHFATYSNLDLTRTFLPDDQRLPLPDESDVAEILKTIGSTGNEKHACESCGFTSCRAFAVSVSQGLSRLDGCLSYSVRSKREYIKSLRKSNEQLIARQNDLESRERALMEKAQKAGEALDTINLLIGKLPSGIVIVDENLRVMASNPAFVNMLDKDVALINEVIPGLKNADLKTLLPFGIFNLFRHVIMTGEDIINKDVTIENNLLNISIYSISPNKIAGAVLRDMYLPEVQKEELEKRLSEAIDQNLKMVQEIGFLLGEGAANTERMLQSLIDTHKRGSKKP